MLQNPSGFVFGRGEVIGFIEPPECGQSFDESNFDAPHPLELDLCLCGVVRKIDFYFIFAVAQYLTGERLNLASELPACDGFC